jgi:hypothetical protein
MIDFDKLIDSHVFREERPKEIGRYYPSQIGSCLRKVWYSYKYPKKIDPEVRKIFEVGNIMHHFIVEVLKSEKSGDVKLLESELPLKRDFKDFVISGRVDDLLLVKSSGKLYLVEVKSTKDIKFVKEANQSHVVQLQFYMFCSGVHNGIVLYIGKGDLKTKTFEVKFNEKISEKIIKRVESLHKDLKRGKLPFAEAKQISDMKWMCKYCEYIEKCDKNEE